MAIGSYASPGQASGHIAWAAGTIMWVFTRGKAYHMTSPCMPGAMCEKCPSRLTNSKGGRPAHASCAKHCNACKQGAIWGYQHTKVHGQVSHKQLDTTFHGQMRAEPFRTARSRLCSKLQKRFAHLLKFPEDLDALTCSLQDLSYSNSISRGDCA